jgi:type III pantothenate kinase
MDERSVRPVAIAAAPLTPAGDLSAAFADWLEKHSIRDARSWLAGSNPEHRDRIAASWPRVIRSPQIVESYRQIPVAVDVEFPERVGIDRLLNALAASRLMDAGRGAVVVDSGTATTIDLVTADGTFRGGSILPGIRLAARALHQYTARLPLVDFPEGTSSGIAVPARNTIDAIRAGVLLGQLGAVRELVRWLRDSARAGFGDQREPQLFVTGGGGSQLVGELNGAVWIDSLPLHGLAMLGAC